MDTIRLTYASLAASEITRSDLRVIATTAEDHNATVGITGAMCYGQGSFLQLLEGSRQSVTELYNKIANDKRHRDATLIEIAPISRRDFSSWSMRYVQLNESSDANHLAILNSVAHSKDFSPRSWTAAQCRALLIQISEA